MLTLNVFLSPPTSPWMIHSMLIILFYSWGEVSDVENYTYIKTIFSSSFSSSLSIFLYLPLLQRCQIFHWKQPKTSCSGKRSYLLINFGTWPQTEPQIWEILHGLALPHSLTFPTHSLHSSVFGLPSSALPLPPTCPGSSPSWWSILGLARAAPSLWNLSLQSSGWVTALFQLLPKHSPAYSRKSCSESAFSVLSCFTLVHLKNLYHFNNLSCICFFGSSALFSLGRSSLFKLSILCFIVEWFLITK